MARFAKEILSDMAHVVAKLETQLGPGTAALTMRVGVSNYKCTIDVLSWMNTAFSSDICSLFPS
jgi:hypothetical protein